MLRAALAGLVLASFTLSASAETIRIAIGTQDTPINCAAGGLPPENPLPRFAL